MNSGVFPASWLHDLGLPISASTGGTVMKNGVERGIALQAFGRGILTYDPQNPPGFEVERANEGADYIFMQKQSQASQQSAVGMAQNVVSAYWRSLDEHNYPAAYEMLASSYKAQRTLEQFRTEASGAVARASGVQFMGAKTLQDGSIQLTVQVTIEPGTQPSNYSSGANTRFFTLVQESGVWRIAAIATAP